MDLTDDACHPDNSRSSQPHREQAALLQRHLVSGVVILYSMKFTRSKKSTCFFTGPCSSLKWHPHLGANLTTIKKGHTDFSSAGTCTRNH